jgi:hypothetical protein
MQEALPECFFIVDIERKYKFGHVFPLTGPRRIVQLRSTQNPPVALNWREVYLLGTPKKALKFGLIW